MQVERTLSIQFSSASTSKDADERSNIHCLTFVTALEFLIMLLWPPQEQTSGSREGGGKIAKSCRVRTENGAFRPSHLIPTHAPPSIFLSHIRPSLWSLHGRRSLEPPPPTALERKREGERGLEREERGNEGRREECPRNSKWNTNTHSVPQIEGICPEKATATRRGRHNSPFPHPRIRRIESQNCV